MRWAWNRSAQTGRPLSNVRFRSEADIRTAKSYVRFTLESGHARCKIKCLPWAKKRTFEKGHQLRCHYSMYDFSSRIAAGEKFPSGVLGFKPFDPTVLIGHLPMPECAKFVVH
jgi:hypothetical protein